MSFHNKVVVVTGAGQGIGEGYAKRCAAEGMRVVVAELNAEQGERVVADIQQGGGEANVSVRGQHFGEQVGDIVAGGNEHEANNLVGDLLP